MKEERYDKTVKAQVNESHNQSKREHRKMGPELSLLFWIDETPKGILLSTFG